MSELNKRIKLTGIKLKAGDAALVYDSEKDMFDIIIPESVDKRARYTVEYQLLTAMYIRLNTDPVWTKEQLEYLSNYVPEEETDDDQEISENSIIQTSD